MTDGEVVFRVVQIVVLATLWWLMTKALRARQSQRDTPGQEQFKAFYWLITAMLLAALAGTAFAVEVNWALLLVVITAGYCAYTLRPRRG